MKILEIQFENINALYGKWRIDFTHPDFIQQGIFAITGPTGAGKSSILDAICLALYGRTPRLDKVNQNHNDILSRKTGHCMAEVLFETKAGQFRCQWAQHRARDSSDGNLQAPKHEISDATTKKIIAHKLKDVAQQVEALTGMNFDRFTRSMLLAQGQFASFLQANADHRAPILEQITGTEIYSQISKEAHSVHSNEKNTLNVLEAEMKGVLVLSPEDEAALLANDEQQEKQCQRLSEQEKEYQRDITWLNHLAGLTQDLASNHSNQQEISQQWQAIQPHCDKLRKAEQALELDAEYQALKKLRTDQHHHTGAYEKLKNQAPEFQRKQTTTFNQAQQAAKDLKGKKDVLQTLAPILKQVREQDVHIGNQQKRLNDVKDDAMQCQGHVSKLQGNLDDLTHQKDELHASIQTLESTLKEHAADACLHEQLSGLTLECHALQEKQMQIEKAQKDVKMNEKALNYYENKHQSIQKHLDDKRQKLGKLQQQMNAKQAALQACLGEQHLSEWRKKKDDLVTARESLKPVLESANQAEKETKKKIEHQHAIQILKTQQNDVAQQCAAMKEIINNSQLSLDIWQQQCDALKAIQSYEKARLQLQDGCPCPLCGSESHPFAQGNIPALDAAEKQLKQKKTQHKAHQEQETKLIIQSEGLKRDGLHHQKAMEACDVRWKEHQAVVDIYYQAHGMNVLDDDFITPLEKHLQAQEKDIQAIESVVTEGEALVLAQESLQTQWHEQRDACAKLENQHVEIKTIQQQKQQEKQRLASELEEITSNWTILKQKLVKQLASYGVHDWDIAALPKIQMDLQVRSQTWQQQEQALTEAKQDSELLNAGHKSKENALKDTQAQALLKQKDVAEKKKCLHHLKQKRSKLFAERNPDEEETALKGMIDELEEAHEKARQASIESKQAYETMQRDMSELCKNIEASRKTIEDTQSVFQETLNQHGFHDEAALCESMLFTEQRQSLKDSITTLEKQKNTVQANITRLKKGIKQQEDLHYTTQTLDECQANLDAVKEALSDANKTMGALEEQRKAQEANKKKLQTQIEKIDAQKRELARWTNLNALIGSGDGKKFRNFAQGLTFELVVQYANQQLRHMSDRYVLQRDQEQPLELNVVDYYQAGEVRSVKNVSGGESFIISLALALGLSQMSSNNVKIDSLFLDEGFGTLDDESLETAIDTLSQLQQDGKIIGIISHVDSIKERIGTQIQVQPISEGRSAISGSGCYAL